MRLFPLGGDAHGRLAPLRRLTPFRDCSLRELQAVERLMTRLDLPADRVLCEQGERGYEVIFLVDGIARVERDGAEVALLGPGEVIGEMAVLSGSVRNATVTAVTPVRVFVLDTREFGAVLEAVPSIRRWVTDVADRRERANTAA